MATQEHTGLTVSYYDVVILEPTNPEHAKETPVIVSCNDIIEALNMNYACANVFKAVWRICAAKMGKMKKGNNTKYDAEKAVFFSERLLVQESTSKHTLGEQNEQCNHVTPAADPDLYIEPRRVHTSTLELSQSATTKNM